MERKAPGGADRRLQTPGFAWNFAIREGLVVSVEDTEVRCAMLEKLSPNELAGGPDPPLGEGAAEPCGGVASPLESRRTVMVVDDDDAIREALRDVLTDEGYEVICAADGRQALERLRAESHPSAILLDLWMPVMDGWKLLDVLSADSRFSGIPLVVFTAARDQRTRDLPVAEVLTKPVQLQQVICVLERLTKVR